jgi:hypothetical protein
MTEAGYQGGVLRTWLVETRKTFIRRTQGGCGAAKAVINDVLSGGVEGASIRNGSAYRNDTPVTEVGQLGFIGVGEVYRDVISNPLLPPPHATTRLRRRRKARRGTRKRGWRVRWKLVLSIRTFKSPLAEILSPVVTRAQWEIAVRSRILPLAISPVVMGILVAIPVP